MNAPMCRRAAWLKLLKSATDDSVFPCVQIHGERFRPQELGYADTHFYTGALQSLNEPTHHPADMDLCCFLAKDAPVRDPSELVELLGRLIEQGASLPRKRF